VADVGETLAVKVTALPLFDGLALDVNVVVVPAWFTVCDSGEDALLEWVPSPLYCAVIECVPTARLEIDSVATPLALIAEVPIVEPPSMNVTVPLAPADGPTVAVNITCCPYADGFSDDVSVVVVFTVPTFTVWTSEADVLPE
jgi:hypothetical protein